MDFLNSHLLTTIIFLPAVGAFAICFMPSKWKIEIRILSICISIGVLLLSALVFWLVDETGEFDFVEQFAWIPSIGINYHVGVDGASALLMLLVATLVPVSVVASWREISSRVKEFHVALLVLATGMLGVFASMDVFLFYVFWEFVLIPMYFIIGIWGSGDRVRAALKFIIFTMAGSVLMLVAMIYASVAANSFGILSWYSHSFTPLEQRLLFIAFAVAFAIKVPVILFHTWLPDAHTEAPTAGSILLAGVLLKMGAYGFFRVAMPAFPYAVAEFSGLILAFAVIEILCGALLAMVQEDLKRLIAYSSISHMGFVMLGLFALSSDAAAGALLQMVNHGLTIGALFALVSMLYARRGTRRISGFKGEARAMPVLSAFFILMALSSIGLPGLNNFVGEFLILLGAFQTRTAYSAIALLGVILVAVYMLLAVQRVFFGKRMEEGDRSPPDLVFREYLVLIPIALLVVALGVWPNMCLKKVWKPAGAFVKLSERFDMVGPAGGMGKEDSMWRK